MGNNIYDVGQPSNYFNYTATGPTGVKAAPGFLKRVVINQKGGSGNLFTLFDNTSATGSHIAVIDTTTAVGNIDYDTPFATGLFLSGTAGTAPDMTIVYR